MSFDTNRHIQINSESSLTIITPETQHHINTIFKIVQYFVAIKLRVSRVGGGGGVDLCTTYIHFN